MKVWVEYECDYGIFEVTETKPRWGGREVDIHPSTLRRIERVKREWEEVQAMLRRLDDEAYDRLPPEQRRLGLMASSGLAAPTVSVLAFPSVIACGAVIPMPANPASLMPRLENPATALPEGWYWLEGGDCVILCKPSGAVASAADLDL